MNVEMTEEDFDLLREAAEKGWPDAVMTTSGIDLGLARIAPREIWARSARKPKAQRGADGSAKGPPTECNGRQ